MAFGDVAYNKNVYNYYRLHGNNVSATMKHKKHLDELIRLYDYYYKKYNLTKDHKKLINKRIKFLSKAWKLK